MTNELLLIVTIAANGTVSITNGGQATITKNAGTDFLLQNNKIYELVVFQAERIETWPSPPVL